MAALGVGGRIGKVRNKETPYWALTGIGTGDGDFQLAVEMVKVVRFWLYLEGRAERIG